MKHGLSRILLIVAGSISVILAVVGMFFPVLPTTPFLLLAAFCFVRSSPRFYHWLINNRWFGTYIRNYRLGLGLPLKQKVLTIALLWLSIGYTAGFVVSAWWGKLILVGIAAGVSIHLLRIKTHRPAAEIPALVPWDWKNERKTGTQPGRRQGTRPGGERGRSSRGDRSGHIRMPECLVGLQP